MRLGVVFPQTEIGADPAAVKDFAQAAEDLGYAATVRSIEPRTPAATPGVITGN